MAIKKYLAAGLALLSLAGCPKSTSELDTLRNTRRARTAESAKTLKEGLDTANQDAVNDYVAHAKAKEDEEMKPLDAAEAEKNKLIKLRDKFYKSLKGLKKPGTQSSTLPSKTTEIYGFSEEASTNPYHFSGLGFRHEGGSRFYSAVGGEFGNSEKTLMDLTTQTDYSGNKQELYGAAGIRLINTEPFKLNLGLRGMYRFQEDVTETSDPSGDSTIKDTTSIPGVALEASVKIGRWTIRATQRKFFGGEGSHEDLESTTLEAGVSF